jgi:hypothetical protein
MVLIICYEKFRIKQNNCNIWEYKKISSQIITPPNYPAVNLITSVNKTRHFHGAREMSRRALGGGGVMVYTVR